MQFSDDQAVMRHALQLATCGEGLVEPNPQVGAVIVDDRRELIAAGYHQQFGGPHAEIHAIRAAGERCRGADLFVTLEPCSHFGKTPPCADAVIAAGLRRVVIGCPDPAPHVAGGGVARLRAAGIAVEVGVCQEEAARLIAPFRTLQLQHRPWVHAKWAMTVDGHIATRTGHSRWISCEQSRATVHQLRGRMDAIITAAGTVRADNPLLTARPPGPRTALRVVLDATGTSLTPDTQLWQTAGEAPVLALVTDRAAAAQVTALREAGIEVLLVPAEHVTAANRPLIRPDFVLQELGRRQYTHALLEGGGGLLGSFFDAQRIDELHVFIAPKLIGGQQAIAPIGGTGLARIPETANLTRVRCQPSGTDLLLQADVAHEML